MSAAERYASEVVVYKGGDSDGPAGYSDIPATAGDLWVDSTSGSPVLKICTASNPYTWSSISAGGLINGVVPPTTEGVDGNLYIDTAASKLYGPKAAGVWPAGVNLIGATGAAGAAGAAGPGFLASQQVVSPGTAGPFTANFELQVFNGFNVFPAGVLNAQNRMVRTTFHGRYTTAVAQVPTVTFSLELATIDIIAITSGALTASLTTIPFELIFESITFSTGASATMQNTAKLIISLDGTTYTTYLKKTTSTGGVDLTGTARPKLNVTVQITALNLIQIDDATVQVFPALVP